MLFKLSIKYIDNEKKKCHPAFGRCFITWLLQTLKVVALEGLLVKKKRPLYLCVVAVFSVCDCNLNAYQAIQPEENRS